MNSRKILLSVPLLAGWCLFNQGCLPPANAKSAKATHVVMVSIDGWAGYYLKDRSLSTPHIDSLRKRGVWGQGRSIFPSMTWPTHTSMVTGTHPRKHGIVGNTYLNRKRRVIVRAWEENKETSIKGPTLYDVAKRAGLTTAAVLWPQSRSAKNLDFNIPEVYEADHFQSYVKPALRKELKAANIPFDKVAEYSVKEELPLDALARDIAVHLIKRHQPRLLMVHFTAFDTWQHHFGPRSPQGRWALQITDLFIGDLLRALKLKGLEKRTAIVITADHGFLAVRTRVDINRALFKAGLVKNPLHPDLKEEKVWAVQNGHMAHIYLLDKKLKSLGSNVRQVLRNLPGLERIIEPSDYNGLGLARPDRDSQVGDLIALARPEVFFASNADGKVKVMAAKYKGMHGYPSKNRQMWIGFVAAGPGIARKTEPLRVNLIDVAPTVLSILGLKPPGSMDGRVVRAVLDRP